jgi:selenocysteine-specific elongation factor
VPAELRVVATAGHVDHGKSSLILRLTGIDPDRFEEEKRRGLTIDLGYAWCTLPSDREVGFVDVPGHERFVGNMLAGVGPVRLVLFVVAADEGWKPQSEEHLQILDVLGVAGGVIALTKRDLVDDETLAIALDEVREQVAGTVLADAPVVPVSATTGEGLDELTAALDAMLASAPAPEEARTRLFVDRVFTIKGAGTVVTGTLGGGCLDVGDEAILQPSGVRARIRSLQTHKRQEETACPVTRVAANLVGVERTTIARGEVLVAEGWTPTSVFDAEVKAVRGLERIPARGAFKVYAGAAEADARLRLLDGPDGATYARIRTAHPLVLDVGDRFVLREAGRRATVGGGTVLDVGPPRAFSTEARLAALGRRRDVARADLPALLAEERGAAPTATVVQQTGAAPPRDLVVGDWVVAPAVRAAADAAATDALAAYHATHPLHEGAPIAEVRAAVQAAVRAAGGPPDPDLAETLLLATPDVIRRATTVRLASHAVALDTQGPDVQRLLAAVGGENEATPPTVKELLAAGIPRDVVDAASRAGTVVRVSPDLVLHPAFVDRAVGEVRAHPEGITVSAFREALGTSRKYAVPLVEWMDREGITRREGDLRVPR